MKKIRRAEEKQEIPDHQAAEEIREIPAARMNQHEEEDTRQTCDVGKLKQNETQGESKGENAYIPYSRRR